MKKNVVVEQSVHKQESVTHKSSSSIAISSVITAPLLPSARVHPCPAHAPDRGSCTPGTRRQRCVCQEGTAQKVTDAVRKRYPFVSNTVYKRKSIDNNGYRKRKKKVGNLDCTASWLSVRCALTRARLSAEPEMDNYMQVTSTK